MNPIKTFLPGMFVLGLACAVSLSAALLVRAQEVSPPPASSTAPPVAPKPSVSRVVVRTLVDGTGAVKATQIRESSGNSRLDEEALQVVGKVWSFSPLKINGKGIEVWVNVPINFVQADTPAALPASAEPLLPVVTDPAPAAAEQPKVVPEPPANTGQAKPAASEAAPVPAPPIPAPPAAPASAPLPPAATPASSPVPLVPEPAASAAQVPASAATPAASAASAAN